MGKHQREEFVWRVRRQQQPVAHWCADHMKSDEQDAGEAALCLQAKVFGTGAAAEEGGFGVGVQEGSATVGRIRRGMPPYHRYLRAKFVAPDGQPSFTCAL